MTAEVMADMQAPPLSRGPFGLFSRLHFEPGDTDEHVKAAEDRHRLRRGLPVVLYRQAPDRECAGAGARRAGGSALAAVLPQFMGAARGRQPRRISHQEIRLDRSL